jgi:putative hydrolase of HD superfamily
LYTFMSCFTFRVSLRVLDTYYCYRKMQSLKDSLKEGLESLKDIDMQAPVPLSTCIAAGVAGVGFGVLCSRMFRRRRPAAATAAPATRGLLPDAASCLVLPAPAKSLDFLLAVGALKRVKRTGWVNHDIVSPESVADHQWRMSLMALLVAAGGDGDAEGKPLDIGRCVAIAVVHDLAEAVCGDITPEAVSGISKAQKTRLENAAMQRLLGVDGALGGGPAASAVRALWDEYEAATTPEARLVKDLDKLEMVVQAFEYERDQQRELPSFFASAAGKVKHPYARALFTELETRRAAAAAAVATAAAAAAVAEATAAAAAATAAAAVAAPQHPKLTPRDAGVNTVATPEKQLARSVKKYLSPSSKSEQSPAASPPATLKDLKEAKKEAKAAAKAAKKEAKKSKKLSKDSKKKKKKATVAPAVTTEADDAVEAAEAAAAVEAAEVAAENNGDMKGHQWEELVSEESADDVAMETGAAGGLP